MHVIHSEDTCPSNCIVRYNQQSLLAGGIGGGDFLSAAAIFGAAGELSDIGAYASAAALDSLDGSNCARGPLPGPAPHALPASGSAIASTTGTDGISWPI